MGAAGGVIASIAWLGRSWDLDWSDIGEISEASGALLSGVALIGVAVSLRMQRRQNQISTFEALRSIRGTLLQFAIEKPRFLRLWGYGSDVEATQDAAYASMVFSYLKMAFVLRFLSGQELVSFCRRAFAEPAMANFWGQAREDYLHNLATAGGRRFALIVDQEYLERESDQQGVKFVGVGDQPG